MTELDPRALRTAFGAFMTGVTVVTTRGAGGEPLGFTANSFTSVSLDPPLVLVCLANTSRNHDAFTAAGGFAVNVLAETQKDLSNTFAKPSENRFAGVGWRIGPAGSPVLDGVSAWFDCAMHRVVPAGDHAILIGAVRAFHTDPAPGLGYARGAYVTARAEAEALDHSSGIMVSALIECDGAVLLLKGSDGALSLPEARVGPDGVSATLARLLAQTGLKAEAGFIYAVYEDSVRKCQHITFLCKADAGQPLAGGFVAPQALGATRIANPAMASMLRRFAEESQLGNFGVYFGTEQSGQVRPMHKGDR